MKNKKIKKTYWIIGIILIIIIGCCFIRFVAGGGEDTWIKDERGVYVKHGNPSGIPEYVAAQQVAILEAEVFYDRLKSNGVNLSSQCLGSLDNYAFDLVNVPRTEEDNLIKNQCEDYIKGKVDHFIELDINGNIVRVS